MKKPSNPSTHANARDAVPTTVSGRSAPPVRTGDPVHEKIARRAYTLWELEGCRQGDDLRHWLSAEHELQGLPPSVHQS